jgi:uncharacterized delta-60 repeat protein
LASKAEKGTPRMGTGRQTGHTAAWERIARCLLLAGTLAVLGSSVGLAGPAIGAVPTSELPTSALDPSFASGGVLTAMFGSTPANEYGTDAAIQPDGKIVVLTTSGYANYLSRYLPNGEPDVTFGDNGSVALPSTNLSSYSAITLDATGRIIVAGSEAGPVWEAPDKSIGAYTARGVVYRYLPGGSLDTSFGSGGKTTINVPPPEGYTPGSGATFAAEVVVAPDGSITVAGRANAICSWEGDGEEGHLWFEYGTFAARLNTDGSFDEHFGSGGLVSTHGHCTNEPGTTPESFEALAQTSPETVLTLANYPEDGTWRFRFYSPTGMLSEVPVPAEGAAPSHIAVLANHDLLVETLGALREFTSDGAVDHSFGTRGSITTNLACTSSNGCFGVLPDGRILVAGAITAPYPKLGVKRYLPDGSVDDTFGNEPAAGEAGGAGEAWAQLTPEADELYVNKLLLLGEQPLVVGAAIVNGSSNTYHPQTALALFQADGGFSSNPPPPKLGEGPFSPLPEPPSEGSGGGEGTGASAKQPSASTGGTSASGTAGHGLSPSQSPAIDRAAQGFSLSLRPQPTILGLLKTGSYRLNVNTSWPGTLSVEWMSAGGQTSGQPRNGHLIIVASGATTFRAGGHGVVRLHLSAAGRQVLSHTQTLRLVTTATFSSGGDVTVTRRGSIILGAPK